MEEREKALKRLNSAFWDDKQKGLVKAKCDYCLRNNREQFDRRNSQFKF